MAVKKVTQFRYYNDKTNNDNTTNYPSTLNYRKLVSGSAFSNVMPIIQLGIQTMPGTKFFLNGSDTPIIIGSTGIYELDLQGLGQINSLQFDASSINLISNNDSAYLIIDIMYEKEG